MIVKSKRPSFCFLLKSYVNDFSYAERLIKSYNTFNVDMIDLFLVVPAKDIEIFSTFKSNVIHVLSDQLFIGDIIPEGSIHLHIGYLNQQIIKLAFGNLRFAENWMCLDSDGEFLRNFTYSDFMYDEHTPFTVLVEDNELRTDSIYFRSHWQKRFEKIEKIALELSFEDRPILTCHGFQIFSQIVIQDLKLNFMVTRGLKFLDLLAVAPYEFSWYNIWLQKSKVIGLHVREPYFKVFHNQHQHLAYLSQGVTRKDLSRGYLGVCVNSNFSRDFGLVEYEQYELYELPLNDLYYESKKIVILWLKKTRKLFSKRLIMLIKSNFNK